MKFTIDFNNEMKQEIESSVVLGQHN